MTGAMRRTPSTRQPPLLARGPGRVPWWREVAVPPSEHGGGQLPWSRSCRPIVAWSWPGLALGLAAMLTSSPAPSSKVVLVTGGAIAGWTEPPRRWIATENSP